MDYDITRWLPTGIAAIRHPVAMMSSHFQFLSRSQADEAVAQVQGIGVDAIAVEARGADPAAPATVVSAAVARWRHIDIIVNNAGTWEDYNFKDMTYEPWERQLHANTTCRLPGLRGMQGAIALARELGHKYNATLNCISPGPIGTELWAQSTQDPEMSKAWQSSIQSTPAAPQVGEVDDIAQIVAFLSEESSRWVTGMVVSANGGLMFD
ncbi:SDR family NAD(P)-dependent oxidoreductase [Aspergillus affinis]|uniref:SDR family NAD(P)-dependent oxidoreductase n=1 Tax=Aspergillus affinis TaxID=1070780 RepID=UPI0022FF16D2|nr:putative gluconate 5-dehydrogenase [Aspergillus affinis]KAI9041123.1 putative gluconate 5-dehydrogenase [Aspergillus affinis]